MRKLLTLIFAGSLSLTAVAGSCPTLLNDIDNRLASAELDAETLVQVLELRAQGEEAHQDGDHDQAMKALERALDLLEQAEQPAYMQQQDDLMY